MKGSDWLASHEHGSSEASRAAARMAKTHANTPTHVRLDVLGRPVRKDSAFDVLRTQLRAVSENEAVVGLLAELRGFEVDVLAPEPRVETCDVEVVELGYHQTCAVLAQESEGAGLVTVPQRAAHLAVVEVLSVHPKVLLAGQWHRQHHGSWGRRTRCAMPSSLALVSCLSTHAVVLLEEYIGLRGPALHATCVAARDCRIGCA